MEKFVNFFERNYTIPKIVVVMPALNEENGIGVVIEGIGKVLHPCDHHILVVDGRSKDKTVENAKENGASVIYQTGKGYGDALMAGFEHAKNGLKADVIVMMDADGTYVADDLPELLIPILENQADMVIGNRFRGMKRGAMPFTNRLGNKILSLVARKALQINIADTQCGLRAFRADLISNLCLGTRGMPFATEMLAEAKQAGARIQEVSISYHPRIGKTKLNPIRDGIRILGTTIRLMRDYRPLLFFGGLGIALSFIGLLIGLDIFLEWVGTGSVVHLASVSLSSLLMVTGVFSFLIGLIADMIKDVKKEIRARIKNVVPLDNR